MKKTVLLLFALTILTFGCAENTEDTIPDLVVPELNIDDEKSTTSESADKKTEKKAKRSTTRMRG